MNLWKKDGKLIVNEDHQPILCDECPCNDQFNLNASVIELEWRVFLPPVIDSFGDFSPAYILESNGPISGIYADYSIRNLSSVIVNKGDYYWDNFMNSYFLSGSWTRKEISFYNNSSSQDPNYCYNLETREQINSYSANNNQLSFIRFTTIDDPSDFSPSSFFPIGYPSIHPSYSFDPPTNREDFSLLNVKPTSYGEEIWGRPFNVCTPSGGLKFPEGFFDYYAEIPPEDYPDHKVPIEITATDSYRWAQEGDEFYQEQCEWKNIENWNYTIDSFGKYADCLRYRAPTGIEFGAQPNIIIDQYDSNFTIKDEKNRWICPSGEMIFSWHSEGDTVMINDVGSYNTDYCGKLSGNIEFWWKLKARPLTEEEMENRE